ncbi:glycoside hydrolase family 65 protein [Lacticaseibacillus sp. GG6-2]
MKTVSLSVTDQAMTFTNMADRYLPRQVTITFDPNQSIGANLERLRDQLVGQDIDAFVLVNPLTYPFSDTVVGLNHRRIDIGLALMNMLNVPVVAQQTVAKIGLEKAVANKREYASWHLDYYGQYTGVRNRGQEAMLTIGNGYYGLRGAYVEAQTDADNYPGFYVAGGYDQSTSDVQGRQVTNEDLVNLPNPQLLSFSVDHGKRFTIRKSDIQDVYRSLDLRTGQLHTTMLIALGTGHQLIVESLKVADFDDYHRLGIRYRLTPLNFAGTIQVYAGIDGKVQNANVARYADLNGEHLNIEGTSGRQNGAVLAGAFKQQDLKFAIASRLFTSDEQALAGLVTSTDESSIEQTLSFAVEPQQTITVDKLVTLYTSRETSGNVAQEAAEGLKGAEFATIAKHAASHYQHVYDDGDIVIQGDLTSQKLLRVNLFHLSVAGSALADPALDASVGARGLHGEAYRGHIFWDEVFMMPYYAQHAPKVAKGMLMYRYRRLDAAKAAAVAVGAKGAMYPWQSASTGDEQSQATHLNPLTNTWMPDRSRLQRHVSLAIAYDIWLYDHLNPDPDFMQTAGWPMLTAIAQYWLSQCQRDAKTKRYHITGVMGPDEFHERYPGADHDGLDDNAYTNLMVAWLFKLLTQADSKGLDVADKKRFDTVRRHLTLNISKSGIIEQFAGYEKLARLDFDAFHKQYGDIARLDRLLKARGTSADSYQVAKQADALMAFYLLDEPTVRGLITDMGYQLPADYFIQNLQFYLDRTTHGSTLSRIVYAMLDAQAGHQDQAWSLYHQALLSDYYDIQGGTTAEGLHLGVMGATLDVATRVFGGINVRNDRVVVKPKLPTVWSKMQTTVHAQNVSYHFDIEPQRLTVTADHDAAIQVGDKDYHLQADQPQTLNY